MKIGILLIKVFLLGCNWLTHNPCKIKFRVRVSPQYIAVTEWLKVMVSKTICRKTHEGSNPSRYAMFNAFVRVLIVFARESRHYFLYVQIKILEEI